MKIAFKGRCWRRRYRFTVKKTCMIEGYDVNGNVYSLYPMLLKAGETYIFDRWFGTIKEG